MQYHKIKINNISIFYRECGDKSKPAMILFHGFPSSSHQFRDLMPLLESKFYLVAPDYPGFGQKVGGASKILEKSHSGTSRKLQISVQKGFAGRESCWS